MTLKSKGSHWYDLIYIADVKSNLQLAFVTCKIVVWQPKVLDHVRSMDQLRERD